MRKRAQTQPTRLHRPARANAGLRAAVGLAFCVALFHAPVLAATGTADATRLTLPDDLPRHASAEGAPDRDEARLEGRLLINPDDPSVVGVLFDLDPGWHLYWRNPGDSGLATEIEFRVGPETAPTQVSDELLWPTPHSFGEDDGGGDPLITYGYGDRVLLSAQLPAPLSAGEELGAEVRALVCERQCIPASLSLSRKVPKTRSPENAARARGLFAHFERQIPRPPKALGARVKILWGQSALRPGDTVAGGIALTSCSEAKCVPLELATETVSFFPEESESLTIEVLGRRALDLAPANTEVLTLRASIETDPPSRLRGVLITYDGEGHRRGLVVDLALPSAPAHSAVESVALPFTDGVGPAAATSDNASGALGFLAVLGFAFAGGLILNLMPCVLPVLAIKVFSVADLAHRNRREVLSHGVAYSAGILATMSLLAGVVIALRSAGHSVGWGFQFQEPLFVVFVCTVVVVFALNLLGVFEIHFDPGRLANVGVETAGARRSFFEGLLAVVLATPCSAPFLGTAVGFAFSSSPIQIVAVFLAIGAGLAAPFALVTAIPAWSHVIPRPGPWMVTLRAGLGFLLLGSAVWLVWVIGRSAGLNAVTNVLAFLLFVSFGFWVYGNLPANRPVWVPAGMAAALVTVALLWANGTAFEQAPELRPEEGFGAVYDPSAIEAELDAGRSVFAYFTADWCITCKVNERRVLSRPEVREKLERLGVAVFRGDWTRRDETIRQELARYGKAGVPVYVVRHPGAEAIVLPELLSVERLFAALTPSHPL